MHKISTLSTVKNWFQKINGDLNAALFAFAQNLRLNNATEQNGRGPSSDASYYYAYARVETRPCYRTQKRRT